MDKIRAPYNFVPLAPEVFFPDWGDADLHDKPFLDGVSGTFDIELVAHTPIFIRGSQGNEFCTLPDGTFAVPGTSIKGMLRNVIEIATFGRMAKDMVDDHRYGVRDLHNRELYGNHMAGILNREPMPLVSAGWMERQEDESFPVRITPCSFAKVDYGKLLAHAASLRLTAFNPGRKQSAPQKYQTWNASREVGIDVSRPRPPDPRWIGEFGTVAKLYSKGKGTHQGQLVFTGQPSDWQPAGPRYKIRGAGNPKHHDFVFWPHPGAQAIPVTEKCFRDFQFIHSDRGQQNRSVESPNPEWKYWSEQLALGEKVPVFFLLEGTTRPPQIRSFGLAMMFRLAYVLSIGDALHNSQPDGAMTRPDFAEALFGRAGDDGNEIAGARGRVSFGLGRSTGPVKTSPPVRAVLGAPKASFYPNYVAQAETTVDQHGGLRVKRYVTWMDGSAKLRGWKRYRPQDEVKPPSLPAKENRKVQTEFRPLEAGTRFRASVRVHNIKRAELGALLWALDFGQTQGVFHTLGMAKSLGYGRVTLSVIEGSARVFDIRDNPANLHQCIEAFEQLMESFAREKGIRGGWRGSQQIYQLLACAKPIVAGSDDGRHMQIDHPIHRNEFVAAKKDMLALAPAGDIASWERNSPPLPVIRPPLTPKSGALPRDVPAAKTAKGIALAQAAPTTLSREDELERKALQQAFDVGKHGPLLRSWMEEKGSREPFRKAIAQKVITFHAKAFKQQFADVIAWMSA